MSINVQVVDLASWRLPEGAPERRDLPSRVKVLSEDFWQAYDSTTLAYDVQYDPADGRLRLYCPKRLNLAHLIAAGVSPGRLRWAGARHLDVGQMRWHDTQGEVRLGEAALTPSVVDRATFRGRNVLISMSRNNDLAWIADWAGWHVRMHGADAVVLSDNNSADYAPEDVAEALAQVEGLRVVRVVRVPHRYGPLDAHCTRRSDACFLQACLLSALRDRYLRSARAVLACDIDELVVSDSGQSVFDAAGGWLGYLTFAGEWRYPAQTDARPRHDDHIMVRPGDAPCATKYCVRPNSPLGRRPMQLHQLAGVPRKMTLARGRFRFLHCHGISTSWKYGRDTVDKGLVRDTATEALMARAFPKEEP